ncbi:unnamed protein product, partial [Ectocarpus sp. 13 AM-2016]
PRCSCPSARPNASLMVCDLLPTIRTPLPGPVAPVSSSRTKTPTALARLAVAAATLTVAELRSVFNTPPTPGISPLVLAAAVSPASPSPSDAGGSLSSKKVTHSTCADTTSASQPPPPPPVRSTAASPLDGLAIVTHRFSTKATQKG